MSYYSSSPYSGGNRSAGYCNVASSPRGNFMGSPGLSAIYYHYGPYSSSLPYSYLSPYSSYYHHPIRTTTATPIYTVRSSSLPPRGRSFGYPRAIPMIAHQRMSPPMASSYSGGSRMSALFAEAMEPVLIQVVAPQRSIKNYGMSYIEDAFTNPLQDIEDEISGWRHQATSILNKYTPVSSFALTPGSKPTVSTSRFSRRDQYDNQDALDKDGIYRPASSYSSGAAYMRNRSRYTHQDHYDDSKPSSATDRSGHLACIRYAGSHAQGKRCPIQLSISDVNKIRNEISTLSHYARMPRKAVSTGPAFSTKSSRLARRASARERIAEKRDPERVLERISKREKLMEEAREAAVQKFLEEQRAARANAPAGRAAWEDDDKPVWDLDDLPVVDVLPGGDPDEQGETVAPEEDTAALDAPVEDAEPVVEEEGTKKKKKKDKKVVKEATPEPEPEPEPVEDVKEMKRKKKEKKAAAAAAALAALEAEMLLLETAEAEAAEVVPEVAAEPEPEPEAPQVVEETALVLAEPVVEEEQAEAVKEAEAEVEPVIVEAPAQEEQIPEPPVVVPEAEPQVEAEAPPAPAEEEATEPVEAQPPQVPSEEAPVAEAVTEDEDIWAGQEEDFIFTRRKQPVESVPDEIAEETDVPPAVSNNETPSVEVEQQEFDWGAVDEDAPRRKPIVNEEQEEEEVVAQEPLADTTTPTATTATAESEEEESEEEEDE